MENPQGKHSLKRAVTGSKCDVQGCYETALWVVSSGGKEYQWCAKHLRRRMKEGELWRGGSPDMKIWTPRRRSETIA